MASNSNRGVVCLKPGSVEVQKIDFPTFRNPVGKTLNHGVILKVATTNICGSGQHMVRGRTTRRRGMEHFEPLPSQDLATLPEAVQLRLSQDNPAADKTAIELVVAARSDWPAIAHLSIGELLLESDGLLRMALWEGSNTSSALLAARQGILVFCGPDQLFELRFTVLAQVLLETSKALRGFLLRPTLVRDKRAPYATMISGLQFELRDPESVRAQWIAAKNALARSFPSGSIKAASI
jgi:hypothetical protein